MRDVQASRVACAEELMHATIEKGRTPLAKTEDNLQRIREGERAQAWAPLGSDTRGAAWLANKWHHLVCSSVMYDKPRPPASARELGCRSTAWKVNDTLAPKVVLPARRWLAVMYDHEREQPFAQACSDSSNFQGRYLMLPLQIKLVQACRQHADARLRHIW